MRSKRSSTRCKAKAPTPAGRRSSVVYRLQPLERPRAGPANAVCKFCDTDFVGTDGPGGGEYSTADHWLCAWQRRGRHRRRARPFVVFTGGEPLLQLDRSLIGRVHQARIRRRRRDQRHALAPPASTGSASAPKPTPMSSLQWKRVETGLPATRCRTGTIHDWEFTHFYLQPMDGPHRKHNTELAVAHTV